MKVLINHSDLDGAGIIILNEYFNIIFDKTHIINYEDITDTKDNFTLPDKIMLTSEDDVILTDISCSKEIYDYIKTTAKSYVLIDHHDETALLVDDPNVIYNEHKSGTMLYYEYLMKKNRLRVPTKLKEMIDLIDVYDRYDDESPLWDKAQDLNRLYYKLYMYGQAPELAMGRFNNYQLGKLKLSDGNPNYYFNDYEKQKIQEVWEKEAKIYSDMMKIMKRRTDNAGNKFAVIALSSKVSITCYNILKNFPEISYVIAINTYGGVNGKVSVRASKDNDIDVNLIEGIHGHRKAGGGQFTIGYLTNFWNNRASYFNYSLEERKLPDEQKNGSPLQEIQV